MAVAAVLLMGLTLAMVEAPVAVHAATTGGVATTAGTDFWVAFEPNDAGGSVALSLSITGDSSTSGEVAWPDGTSSSFSVTAGQITTVDVPDSVTTSMQNLPIDGSAQLGVHITADAAVSVYGLSYNYGTSGAFVGIPTSALGTTYRALTYTTTISSFPGRMMAVATQDDTTLTVTPENTYGDRTAGVPYTVTLNAGDVYSLGAPGDDGDSSEISGTLMTSDKPIAAFAGVDCGNIGNSACDLESNELFPTTEWGTDFVVPRFDSAANGDPVRVQAHQDNTVVTVNGSVVATLSAGQYYEGTVGDVSGGNTALSISTSKPVEVAEFMINDSYGESGVTGDPDELIVPPYQQFLSSYTVATPGTGFAFNAINIVIPTAATSSLKVDGQGVDSSEFAAVAGTTFSTAQLPVGSGTHTLSAAQPFGAFAYGANDYNSYSYPGGSGLSPVATISNVTLTSAAPSSAEVGQQACFTVTATNSDGDPVAGVRVDLTVTGDNAGDTGNNTTGDDGTATVCYSGANPGADTVTLTSGTASTTANLTWTSVPTTAPSITTAPQDRTVTSGTAATFTAAASGSPAPTFQWQLSTDGGTTWTDVSGATDASYTTTDLTTSQSGSQYRVVATNSAGSATSDPATVTVTPTPTAPAITSQPTDDTVTAGQAATFTVGVSGTPTATVQWQVSTDGGATWADVMGATGATYTTGALTAADNGNRYRAVTSNSAGTTTSDAAAVTVTAAPVAPAIGNQPKDVTVNSGDTATFTTTVTGSPAPTLQWQVSTDGGTTWTTVSGATGDSYTTGVLTAANSTNQYRVVATNTAGTVNSNSATVTVTPEPVAPVVTTPPSDVTTTAGSTATFTVTTTGTPVPAVQWQISTDGGTTWVNIDGATGTRYTTGPLTAADTGHQYRAVATNSAGSTISGASTVTVTPAGSAPTVLTQPVNTTVHSGSRATFTATSTANPGATVQWQELTHGGSVWSNVPGATSDTLTTGPVTTKDDGIQYRAVFTNALGDTDTTVALLTVTGTAPIVTTQPKDVTTTAGKNVTFSVASTSDPVASIQWQVSIDHGTRWSAIRGATGATLTLAKVSTADNGDEYRAVLGNAVATVTSDPATLTVHAVAATGTTAANTGPTTPSGLAFTGSNPMLPLSLALLLLLLGSAVVIGVRLRRGHNS